MPRPATAAPRPTRQVQKIAAPPPSAPPVLDEEQGDTMEEVPLEEEVAVATRIVKRYPKAKYRKVKKSVKYPNGYEAVAVASPQEERKLDKNLWKDSPADLDLPPDAPPEDE